ncbi:MAG: hypothetical protein JWM47_1654 [Acidimicrobiales bacterium]|nr:hypothetical protein [Acidimicrobiales bacterium]
MLLADGSLVTSTAPDAHNPSVELCHETGAYCEAFKRGQAVVASACLHSDANGRLVVLSPCGVCLERLAVHGPDVLVAVPEVDAVFGVRWVRLREALPYYWAIAFAEPDDPWDVEAERRRSDGGG